MKKIIKTLITTFAIAVLALSLVSCSKKNALQGSDLTNAIATMTSYTVTTTVTAPNGIYSKTTERVTIDGETVTVVTETITPNAIGGSEQYSTVMNTDTYQTSAFNRFALNVSSIEASLTVDADSGAISGTFPKEAAAAVIGADTASKTDITLKAELDIESKSLKYAEITYTTNDNNSVVIRVVPNA